MWIWINPDIAFKKSKKTDPIKTTISQPLRYAHSVGPESCEMVVLIGPNLKTIPWSL
jgi:hypothetical protein